MIPLEQCRKCRYRSMSDARYKLLMCDYIGITGRSQILANIERKEGEPCRAYEPRKRGAKTDRASNRSAQVVHYAADGKVLGVYESLHDAAISTGVSYSTIYRLCNQNKLQSKTATTQKEESFRFLEEAPINEKR